jgi:uncharacterized damage-inducible protein DinB
MAIAPAAIRFPRLRSPLLDASSFTGTRFNDAASKAQFGNKLLTFIAEGFPETRFKPLYQRLSQTFGHIAHCDQYGFWSHFFAHTEGRIEFLEQTTQHPCYGAPEHTFSDVEWVVRQRVCEAPLLEAYRAARAAEITSAERELLCHLQVKHRATAAPLVSPSPIGPTRPPQQLDLLAL